MSNPSTENLLVALHDSPDNQALRSMVLGACLNGGDADALRKAIELCGESIFQDDTDRMAAIRLLSESKHDDLVIRLSPPGSAPALLSQARLAMSEGRRDEAHALYQQAIGLNPALENSTLASEISGKIVSLADARGRVQTSIVKDETTTHDVVRALRPQEDRITFADVGGLDDIKQQVRRRIITPFLKPSLFEQFKRKSGGGILLYGPPGCGKTLLARATAGECGAKFHNVTITDVLDMYIGESERKLHAIFELARRTAPAVVFFDEIEALGGKRQHSREAGSAKVVSQFLTELDGFAHSNKDVLILGATNVPWAVDSAFRRPGRFDRVLFVPPPDEPARRSILNLQLAGRPIAGGLDVNEIARLTSGFSGADLRHLVETGIDEAIEQSIEQSCEVPLSMAHLRAALKVTRPTTLEWLTTARNHARYANQGGQYDEVLDFLKHHGGD